MHACDVGWVVLKFAFKLSSFSFQQQPTCTTPPSCPSTLDIVYIACNNICVKCSWHFFNSKSSTALDCADRHPLTLPNFSIIFVRRVNSSMYYSNEYISEWTCVITSQKQYKYFSDSLHSKLLSTTQKKKRRKALSSDNNRQCECDSLSRKIVNSN